MTKLLFPTFLEDEAVYDEAVAFWRELFEELLSEIDLSYEPYLNTTAVNGTPLRDGNPIFNAYFPALGKAVRIIQEEPEEGEEAGIGAWLDIVETETDFFPELVISLVLSEEVWPLVKKLLAQWLVDDLGEEEMMDFLEGLEEEG